MFRKHTRRAAKAAFAIAIGVPLILGGSILGGSATASHTKRAAGPTIIVGTKNFTEEFILGQLYKQALEAKGFNVQYKESIGSSEIIDAAATSGKINFYPEYMGVIVQDIAHQKSPKTAALTYAAAKKFEEGRGFTLLNRTPFFDTDSFGILTKTAKKYKLKTISDVKKVKKTLKYGGFPECKTRITCFLGLQKVYKLKNIKFVPLASISIYTLLDQGKVGAGDVFSTDPQLDNKKYTVLKDTKHLFGFQNVAPVVSKSVVAAGGSKFANTVNAVTAKLSLKAIRAMNRAVAINKQSPADVADAFLKANNLK